MKASQALRWARLHAGLSQRALSVRTRIPQSTIARIEADGVDPRFNTLERLLQGCGCEMEVAPVLGHGVDRSLIRAFLRLSPTQRVARLAEEARWLATLDGAARQMRGPAPKRHQRSHP